MPPQTTGVAEEVLRERKKDSKGETGEEWNYWDHLYHINIVYFILLHIGAVYGLTLVFTQAKVATFLFGTISWMDTFKSS